MLPGHGGTRHLCLAAQQSSGESQTSNSLIGHHLQLQFSLHWVLGRFGPVSDIKFKTRHRVVQSTDQSIKAVKSRLGANHYEARESGPLIDMPIFGWNLIMSDGLRDSSRNSKDLQIYHTFR